MRIFNQANSDQNGDEIPVHWVTSIAEPVHELRRSLELNAGTVHLVSWQEIPAVAQGIRAPSVLVCALPLPPATMALELSPMWARLEQVLSRQPGLAIIWLLMPTASEGVDDYSVALPAFLQEAMRAGVREVLTNPANTADMANLADIRQAIDRQQTRLTALRSWPGSRVNGDGENLQSPASVVAFVGSKGGSGTTVLATHWAWALAQNGLRVGVLDLGLMQGDAAMHLSDKVPAFTWSDAALQTDRIDGAWLWGLMLECQSNLRILPSPALALTDTDAWAHITLNLVQQCTDALRAQVDVLVMDAGSQWSSLMPWIMQSAQSVALIAQPSLPHLHHAQQWLQAMNQLGIDLNKVQGILNATYRHAPMAADEFQLACTQVKWRCIPRSDDALAQAVHQGVAIGQYQPRDGMARALSGWADEWWQNQCPHSSQLNAAAKNTGRPWWNRWRYRALPAVMAESSVSAS